MGLVMETRVASLLVQAEALQRRIYSSLPWGYRLARIFQAISTTEKANWGMMMGLVMLRAGVTGMPDPGPGYKPNNPKGSRLPAGYAGLDQTANVAYGMIFKALRDPARAEDVFQSVVMAFWANPSKMEPVALSAAKSFVLGAVKLKILEAFRKIKEQETSLPTDEEGNELDLVDTVIERNPYWTSEPRQFDRVKDTVPEAFWKNKVMPAVQAVHPNMPFFFELLDQDYDMKEIVEGDMLPDWGSDQYDLSNPAEARKAVAAWSAKVQKARGIILDTIRDYLERD